MPLRLPLTTLKDMAVDHIGYEVDRLAFWTYRTIETRHLLPSSFDIDVQLAALHIAQTTLESAPLHLRVVSDFLTRGRPASARYETDVVADDYFTDGWKTAPTVLLGKDKAEHQATTDELNRRLMHLSYQRLDGDGVFTWNTVLEHVPTVLAAMQRFIKELKVHDAQRGGWFDEVDRIIQRRFEEETRAGSNQPVVAVSTSPTFPTIGVSSYGTAIPRGPFRF